MHLSGHALTSGVEEHRIEGVPVRVFTPAKTVADCFKFRNKIGLDVALEPGAIDENTDQAWMNLALRQGAVTAVRPRLETWREPETSERCGGLPASAC
jgi:predicted transcriptional regulator of viral defense system